MRRSRRRQRKSADDRKGIIVVTLALILIVAFVGLYIQLTKNFIERDSLTLCREDNFISRETALLVDATETYTDAQAILIGKQLESILNDSLVDERFTFYSLDEEINDFRPDFLVCNPGDGSDQSEYTANKRRLYDSWEENFYNRIRHSVEELIGDEPADFSPIMEMIKYVSIQTMFGSQATEKRLVVISDMLHNTPQFSHYSSQESFEQIKGSPYMREVAARLEGAAVEILYILRPLNSTIQNRGHIENFWRPYINASNGRIILVDPVN